jgi:hypothetical protein
MSTHLPACPVISCQSPGGGGGLIRAHSSILCLLCYGFLTSQAVTHTPLHLLAPWHSPNPVPTRRFGWILPWQTFSPLSPPVSWAQLTHYPDGGSMDLWNFGNLYHSSSAQQPRRQPSLTVSFSRTLLHGVSSELGCFYIYWDLVMLHTCMLKIAVRFPSLSINIVFHLQSSLLCMFWHVSSSSPHSCLLGLLSVLMFCT